ncbi:hypothetical protein AAG612_10890 [Citromicrobium bathyomarinum]
MSEPTHTREERLAQQLRTNLRRRKMQAGKPRPRADDALERDLSKDDDER